MRNGGSIYNIRGVGHDVTMRMILHKLIDNYMMQNLMYRLVPYCRCPNRLNSLLVIKNAVNNITGTGNIG